MGFQIAESRFENLRGPGDLSWDPTKLDAVILKANSILAKDGATDRNMREMR